MRILLTFRFEVPEGLSSHIYSSVKELSVFIWRALSMSIICTSVCAVEIHLADQVPLAFWSSWGL